MENKHIEECMARFWTSQQTQPKNTGKKNSSDDVQCLLEQQGGPC